MNLVDEAKVRLQDISIPQHYVDYQLNILNQVNKLFTLVQKARKKGYDVTNYVEPKIAYDLSDRVAKMHNIDISDRLRTLLKHTTKEKAALKRKRLKPQPCVALFLKSATLLAHLISA